MDVFSGKLAMIHFAKLSYITLLVFLISGCAATQWVFRHAEDREVHSTESIESLNSVFLSERKLLIDINVNHKGPSFNQTDKRLICLDRIAFSPNPEGNTVPISAFNYQCPRNDGKQKGKRLAKAVDERSLIFQFHETEESYFSSTPVFQGKNKEISFKLLDGHKSRKQRKGSKLYYLMLPLTVPFDILTSPIQWGMYVYQTRKYNTEKREKL